MLLRIQKYFGNVSEATIEGSLYVAIATCGFLATQFGGDEAYKLFTERTLFWIKTVNGVGLAGATALKMFRSNVFAKHQQTKKEQNEKQNSDTQFVSKPPTV